MDNSLTTPALAALGFLLGFFYTRSMRLAEILPEKYATKKECQGLRADCRHVRDIAREDVIQRLDRLEDKLDRLTETLLERGAA